MNEGPIKDITERSLEFEDFENKKVKIIILDGETGKVSLVQVPHHGRTVIESIKGAARKVRFEDDHLL